MPCHLIYALWLRTQFHLDTMPCHLWFNFYLDTMPCHLDYAIYVSISFGHYAVPFDLCPLLINDLTSVGHYAVPIERCHLWFNFIWTLCRAIWHVPFRFDDPPPNWTLCRAIWTMPYMIDDSISFGHDAVPLELCHHDWWCNFTWSLCRAVWTMLVMSERTNFIWTLCRAFWTMPAYELWLNLIWTLCRANWTTLFCDWCFNRIC